MNLLLTLIIALVVAVASFITSAAKLYDNSNRVTGFGKLRIPGRWTLGLLFVSILLTALQSYLNEKDQDQKLSAQKHYYDSSLAVMLKQARIDNQNTVVTITKAEAEALGKYGYKFDSTTQLLTRIIRDSSKTKIISGPTPVLGLCRDNPLLVTNSGKNRIYKFDFNFCSYDAGSTDYNIAIYSVLEDTLGNLYYGGKNTVLDPKLKISLLAQQHQEFRSRMPFDTLSNIYFYVTGNYRSLDNSKLQYIDLVYQYEFSSKTSATIIREMRARVLAIVKPHSIKANSNHR